ncbi:Ribonuclease P protein subunit p30 [Chytriomyces hyalinus]|nr:Ribonuclease P protein subunit p30 [Chytriomyces hyalinus]
MEMDPVGYQVAAINTTVSGKNAFSQVSIFVAPIKKDDLELRSLPFKIKEPATQSTLAPEISQAEPSTEFRLLNRLTIALDDSNLNLRIDVGNSKLQKFDILAVSPRSERAFQNAASNADVDIISLELAEKMPFHIKKGPVSLAIQRGIVFEVCYGQCIRDANARKSIISNLQSLLRATNGKNIIFTSDAMKGLDIRSPHDVINLAQVFGMPDRYARESISTACRSALYHAATRRNTMKGVVSVESTEVLSEALKWKMGAAPTDEEMNSDFVAFGDMMDDE